MVVCLCQCAPKGQHSSATADLDRVQIVRVQSDRLRTLRQIELAPIQFGGETRKLAPATQFDLAARVHAVREQHVLRYPQAGWLQEEGQDGSEKSAQARFVLLNYEELSGSRAGAGESAGVFLELGLFEQASEQPLFLARYSFHERPITENLFDINKKLRDQQRLGAGFKSAAEIFEDAVNQLLIELERQKLIFP